MTKAYFKNTAGAVLVYDVCNRKSFENLRNIWLKQLKEQGYTDARLILGELLLVDVYVQLASLTLLSGVA